MAEPILAIDGGRQAVMAPMDDAWQPVSDLEKRYVNHILDHFGDA